MSRLWLNSALLMLLADVAGAQEGPIEDNSFLVEEAYNQEAGVVQHVTTFDRAEDGSDWIFSFTQEWPAPDQRHQLSYTVPVLHLAGEEELGGVALNYRYQWLGVGGGRLAFAPRLSLLLPSGNDREGWGADSVGLEVNLPVSAALGERFVGHWNLGGTWAPGTRGTDGAKADARAIRLAQGLIFLARPTVNALLEAVWSREESVVGESDTEAEDHFFLSPGVRFAINLPSGLQIVPGVAAPLGVGPSEGERSIFLYISFEHPFGPSRARME